MAVDTQKLFYLLDPVFQIENLAGKPVVGGHIEVFVAGTDTKYITWQDWGGARNPFKIPLRSDGRAVILVEPQYTYDVYVYDSFNNMVCSRLNVSPAIGGDVSVSGLTQVYHDETISGNGTPYEPLGIVSGGKTYEGIEPIVVNNDVNKISANNVALGLQEPLFFVEDSETACVIGCSAQTEIPSALSGKWDDASDVVIANSAQWAEQTEYEAGSYVDIDNNTISVTGLQPEGDYAYNSALSSKLDVTALPQDLVHSGDLTAYQPAGDYLSASDSANFLLTSDSGNFYPMESNPSGYINELPSDLATTGWVDSQGYITGVDIPESAVWNATTQTVSANSAQWAGGTANPQIPVTSTSGISIFESGDKVYFNISADYAFNTALQNISAEITGMIPAPFDPTYLSGQIDNKLDSAIYAADSGTFLTALPADLVYTADIADMATTADLATKQDSLTFGYHDTAISSIDNSAVYDNSAHARINTLAGRISDLSSNKLDSAIYAADSGTFLTALPSDLVYTADIADMATTAQVAEKLDTTAFSTVSGDFLTEVPDTYLQNTDLGIVDNKVTAISGIVLSAGTELNFGYIEI